MMENTPFNILFCDCDLNLKYANPASMKTLKTLEQYLPIRVDAMTGKSIDIFYKNPVHQRKMLSDPRNLRHTAQIEVEPEILDLVINAIYDQDKNFSGVVVNWSVITEILKLKKENEEITRLENERSEELQNKVGQILEVVNAAAQGDISEQLNVMGSDLAGQVGHALADFIANLRVKLVHLEKRVMTSIILPMRSFRLVSN
jgi:methyl-accepting chemotaxis protein